MVDNTKEVSQASVNRAYEVMEGAGVKGLDDLKRLVYPVGTPNSKNGGARNVVVTRTAALQVVEENAPAFMQVTPRKRATYIFLIDNLFLKNAMRTVIATGAFDGDFMDAFVQMVVQLIAHGGDVAAAALALRGIVDARRAVASRKTKLAYKFFVALVVGAAAIALTAYFVPSYDPLVVDAARVFALVWAVAFAIAYVHNFVPVL